MNAFHTEMYHLKALYVKPAYHTVYRPYCAYTCILSAIPCSVTQRPTRKTFLVALASLLQIACFQCYRLDWIVQCFTSPPTQYRLYGRRFL